MQLPEGWKRRKKQLEQIPSPDEFLKLASCVTGTEFFFTIEEAKRQQDLIDQEHHILDLMKEMAEALELVAKHPIQGPMSDLANKALHQIAAESVLIKFKDWK